MIVRLECYNVIIKKQEVLQYEKKLFALAVSTCLALGPCVSIPVSAEAEHSIETRAQQCGNCGGMTLYNRTTYGDWVLIGQQKCKKQWNLSDNVYRRTVTKGYKCSKCGYSYTYSNSTESKVVCNH